MTHQERMTKFATVCDSMAERYVYGDRRSFIRSELSFLLDNGTFSNPIEIIQSRKYKVSVSGTAKANETWANKMHQKLVNLYFNM